VSEPHESIRELISDSRRLKNAIDLNANILAELLEGNLRNVSTWRLKKLKRELQTFNAHTGKWIGGAA